MIDILAADEAGTARIGAILGRDLCGGDLILLRGDLGAGKTSLARAIIRGVAGAAIDVPSPTFALIEPYDFETPLYHLDLYRLDDADQAVELGLEDMMEAAVLLVEWPERAPGLFTGPRLEITIGAQDDGARMIRLDPQGKRWEQRLGKLGRELTA